MPDFRKNAIMSGRMENPWWKNAVFYELYVDKFAGNFRALADRLAYLRDLGIDCIHLLPHYPSPMIDGGYDIYDYKNVRAELGTLNDFYFFISQADSVGIKVMVDLVLNHTSIQHPWFQEALSNPKSPKRNYYFWSMTGKEFPDAVNAFPHIKKRNWIYSKQANAFYFATFYPEQPDLNLENPEVFKEITSIMDFWVSRGVSVFRLDALSHIVKREGTRCKSLSETHALVKKFRAHLNRSYPEIIFLGEVSDIIENMHEYFGNGDECHLVYHFPLAEALLYEAITGKKGLSEEFFKTLADVPKNCSWVVFLRNHDEISVTMLRRKPWQGLLQKLGLEKEFGFESGVAMRLKNVCEKSVAGEDKCTRTLFEKLLSFPAPAILYYGDEIGMGDLPAAKRKDARLRVRGHFDWREAQKQSGDPNSTLSFVKNLIHKRKSRYV